MQQRPDALEECSRWNSYRAMNVTVLRVAYLLNQDSQMGLFRDSGLSFIRSPPDAVVTRLTQKCATLTKPHIAPQAQKRAPFSKRS